MRTTHIVVAVAVALVATIVGRFISITEMMKEVSPYGPTMCLKVPSLRAPEDMQLIPGSKHILMGTNDYMTMLHTPGKGPQDTPSGGIATMQSPIDSPLVSPVELQNWPTDVAFHPHGLYIRNDTLYVLNHAYSLGGERIEVFLISHLNSPLSLTYQRSIRLPDYMMGISNDLAFMSPFEFFITTSSSHPTSSQGPSISTWETIRACGELILGLELTFVYRCREKEGIVECIPVASGQMMNGITIRKEELWVADTIGKLLKRYHIEPEQLVEMSTIPTSYMVDNLEYDPVSDLIYLGVLGRAWDSFAFIQKAHSGEKPEGGITGGCDELDPKTGQIRHILMQEKQNAVSSCTRSGMFIVMGSWQEPHVLVCPLEDPKK